MTALDIEQLTGLIAVSLNCDAAGLYSITAAGDVAEIASVNAALARAHAAGMDPWSAIIARHAPPDEVGSGQIRAALIALDVAADDDALDSLITTAITNAVADAKQRAIALTLWRNAATFKRDNAFVVAVQAALGKTDADMDNIFRLAATF